MAASGCHAATLHQFPVAPTSVRAVTNLHAPFSLLSPRTTSRAAARFPVCSPTSALANRVSHSLNRTSSYLSSASSLLPASITRLINSPLINRRGPPRSRPFPAHTEPPARVVSPSAKYLGKFGSAPVVSRADGAAAAARDFPSLVRQQLLPLTAAVLLPVLATAAVMALCGPTSSTANEEWYRALNPPAYAPQDWVFGAVWTVLQLPAGVAAWLVGLAAGGASRYGGALELYCLHLFLGLLWPVVMFKGRNVDGAMVVAGALAVSSLSTLLAFSRTSAAAALLFLPLALFTALLTTTTFAIWTNHSTSSLPSFMSSAAAGMRSGKLPRWDSFRFGGDGGGGGGLAGGGESSSPGNGWEDESPFKWSAAPSNQNTRRDT